MEIISCIFTPTKDTTKKKQKKMSENATDEQVQNFMSMTGLNMDQAKYIIEACGNNIEVALNLHLEGGAPMPSAAAKPAPKPCPPTEKKDDDKANDMYVGGGQAVMMGDNSAKSKDLMDAAKALGAITPEEAAAKEKNWGGGRRLGSTDAPTPSAPSTAVEDVQVKITIWSNGFSVDDGPVRNSEEPENKQFLDNLKTGNVPPEIVAKLKKDYPGKIPEVVFTLVDNSAKEYEVPKQTFQAFTGAGRSMASSSSSGPPTPAQQPVLGKLPSLDDSKPSTSIQVCLPDGTKMTARLNLTHTIADLASFVHHSRPGQPPFKLMTSFPRKVLFI